MSLKSKKILCCLALLLAAFFWGTTFVAQKSAADEALGTFTFNGIRSLIGSAVLLPLALTIGRPKKRQEAVAVPLKKQLLYGSICGVLLFFATNLQQFGLNYTTAGKSGFITALYVVLVPLFSLVFFRRSSGWNIWLAVVLAAAGLYLLCVEETFTLQIGDAITLVCSVVFAFHILTVDSIGDRVAGVTLSCIQFFVSGMLSTVCMFLFEHPTISGITACYGQLLYAGVLSSGVAYTLQIVGQKHTEPAVASLLMSLESVFAVLSGWLVLKENMTSSELSGCVIMFVAIVIAQLPLEKLFIKNKKECKVI
jgi:drug/metabolite transporter (DMT)-like permease